MAKDYTVRIYDRNTNVAENIYVLSGSREKAQLMVEELYPEATVQFVIEQGEW